MVSVAGAASSATGAFVASSDGAGADPHLMVHYSDRGSQYVVEDYTRQLKALGMQLSVGSTGDSYDNALAESVNGAYKVRAGKGLSFESVGRLEVETAGWVL